MRPAAALLAAVLLSPSGAVVGATTARRLGRRPDEQGRDSGAGVGTRRRHTPAERNDGRGGGRRSAYLRNELDRRRTETGRPENDRGTRYPDENKGHEGPLEYSRNGSGQGQGGPNTFGGPTARQPGRERPAS